MEVSLFPWPQLLKQLALLLLLKLDFNVCCMLGDHGEPRQQSAQLSFVHGSVLNLSSKGLGHK